MHTKECLAYAIICAVENLRDEEGMTDLDFRLRIQDNTALTDADGYLEDTSPAFSICRCPRAWVLWYGGHSYAHGYIPEDLVEMRLDDVIAFCENRYYNRDGQTPGVDETSEAWVFLAHPRDTTDPYPDKIVKWDPVREGYTMTDS